MTVNGLLFLLKTMLHLPSFVYQGMGVMRANQELTWVACSPPCVRPRWVQVWPSENSSAVASFPYTASKNGG